MSRPFVLACLATTLLADTGRAFAFKCMPLYSNWCGIRHPAVGLPPPVDAFDATCMRHDLCTGGPFDKTGCDIAFVTELCALAAQTGCLPRPLQWAEYVIRVKSGGPWGGMPMPPPMDAFGAMTSLAAPCWLSPRPGPHRLPWMSSSTSASGASCGPVWSAFSPACW